MVREAARLVGLAADELAPIPTNVEGRRADDRCTLANAYTQLAIASALVAFVADESEPEREEMTREQTGAPESIPRGVHDRVHRMAADVTKRIREGEEPEAAYRNAVRAEYNAVTVTS